MIFKLIREINRKVQSANIYAIYKIFPHSFRYFLLFWKKILFYIKKLKINVHLVDNTNNSSIHLRNLHQGFLKKNQKY